MKKTNPVVDQVLSKKQPWAREFEILRKIALDCDLTEELKWGQPCYSLDGKNIVLIHGFKEYCAYLFFKGALLKDPQKIMIQQTENVQSARQIRFTSVDEIESLRTVLKEYIQRAIEVEKAGLKVKMKSTKEFTVPPELKAAFKSNPKLKAAFQALTPGRQRAYILHFSSAKQASTVLARIEKCTPRILEGKGLMD
ncbi:MAG: YdeI/OmpD-associated family protein [Gemmataceae bacterium]